MLNKEGLRMLKPLDKETEAAIKDLEDFRPEAWSKVLSYLEQESSLDDVEVDEDLEDNVMAKVLVAKVSLRKLLKTLTRK